MGDWEIALQCLCFDSGGLHILHSGATVWYITDTNSGRIVDRDTGNAQDVSAVDVWSGWQSGWRRCPKKSMYCYWTFILSISQNNTSARIFNCKKFDWIWSTKNCLNLISRHHSRPDSCAVIMQTKCNASSILCCTKSFAFDFFHLFLPAMAKPKWKHEKLWI